MNISLVVSIARFIFAQLPLLLSIRLFIVNVPPLQNAPTGDPNGNYDPAKALTFDPTEYLLN